MKLQQEFQRAKNIFTVKQNYESNIQKYIDVTNWHKASKNSQPRCQTRQGFCGIHNHNTTTIVTFVRNIKNRDETTTTI